MNIKNKLVPLLIIFLLTAGLLFYMLYDRRTTSIMSLDPIDNSISSIEKEPIIKSDFTYKPKSENLDTNDNNSTDQPVPTTNAIPTNETLPANGSILKSMSMLNVWL